MPAWRMAPQSALSPRFPKLRKAGVALTIISCVIWTASSGGAEFLEHALPLRATPASSIPAARLMATARRRMVSLPSAMRGAFQKAQIASMWSASNMSQ